MIFMEVNPPMKMNYNIDNIGSFLKEMEALCKKYDVSLAHSEKPIVLVMDNKTHAKYEWLLSDYFNEF